MAQSEKKSRSRTPKTERVITCGPERFSHLYFSVRTDRQTGGRAFMNPMPGSWPQKRRQCAEVERNWEPQFWQFFPIQAKTGRFHNHNQATPISEPPIIFW
jgi:hypothetical protein